ncbi:MAG TPA: superoxide dismutase family protein [Methylomirabilota bacterium]|jgi:Cu-Zn family superoxide dismutase|nr:superoxide dismutase family protein [Methylomirabilota bacterium]
MNIAVTILLASLLGGCAAMQPAAETPGVAELRNATGQAVGTAHLAQAGNAVRLLLEARGLPPGLHAVHIHAVGKCDPPDFTSAGPHFNPGGKQHGALNPQGAHAGDLPNINVGADGNGRLETATEMITLGTGTTSIWDADGSALVVHAAPDDFTTDPTGNAGARIACGVITKETK